MSLQVWLPLNDNLDNNGLSDITATNYGATVNNNGKLGKCYSFNGSSNYITIPSLSIPENFSICIWGKWNSLNNWSRLLDFGSLASGKGYGFLIANSNTTSTMNFSYECGSGSVNVDIDTIAIDIWYHIAVTFQGTNIKVYLNGNLITTITSASPVGGHTFNYNYLGKSNWSTDALLNGCLNDFRIYDHCLSAKEVKEISKGLMAHYKLSGVGNTNLLVGNYSNYKTATTNNSSGNLTLDTNLMPYSSMVGKTFTFTFDYSCEGSRANSGSGMDNRYGLHLGLNITPNGGTATQQYPCADYLYMSGTGRAVQSFSVPSNCTVNSFSVAIQPTTKPSNDNDATWYIKNVKLEEGSKATPWCPNPSDALYSTLGFNDGIEYDCSGYENNGTKSGSIVWSGDSARYSGSYYLGTETATYINTPNFNFENMQQGTVSLWINRHSTNSNWRNYLLFANSYNWTGLENDFIIFGSTGTNAIIMDCCSNTYDFIPDLNKWYLYTISWDLVSHTTKMYVNGELKKTITNSTIDTTYASKHNYHFIGNALYSESDYSLSDFRLYSTCLSDEDVKSLYNVSASINKTGVLTAYEFVEEE